MDIWEFFKLSSFVDLLAFFLYRKKRVLLKPPTYLPPFTDHGTLVTYPPTHRLTIINLVKIEHQIVEGVL